MIDLLSHISPSRSTFAQYGMMADISDFRYSSVMTSLILPELNSSDSMDSSVVPIRTTSIISGMSHSVSHTFDRSFAFHPFVHRLQLAYSFHRSHS